MDSIAAMVNIAIPIAVGMVALVAIGLVVTRLYRRASKETAFVRTGFRGQHVVVNGGCMVFPVLHETIPVNMKTLRLEVVRTERQALITRDRMRVDVQAEFYVRVQPTEESIAAAAQTLGRRTMAPEQLRELVEGKFVDGLRSAAAKMGMEDLHEKRSEFVLAVQEAVQEDLLKNGLELESVSLTGFNQTSKEYFDVTNAFDAEGLTMLTEQIESRRLRRNQIERDTAVEIARKDLESERAQLEIRRESEYLKLEQEREIETRRAEQNAQVSGERAEGERAAAEATINAERDTEAARIASDKALEEARIERTMTIRLAEQAREIAIFERSQQESAARAGADAAKADAVTAEEAVITAREQAKAERTKLIELVEARQEAEREAIKVKIAAESREVSAVDEPGEEPAQCLVLALPPSRRRSFAATELTARLQVDVLNSDIAGRTSEGTKNPRIRQQEDRPQGPLQGDVRLDGLGQRHVRPPRSSKATWRSMAKLTQCRYRHWVNNAAFRIMPSRRPEPLLALAAGRGMSA